MPKKIPTDTAPRQTQAKAKEVVAVAEDGIRERIKEARQLPGNDLNVEALSRLCREYDPQSQGITRTTLLRYESGVVLPGARELRILCDALGVSADWLLLGVGAMSQKGLSMEEMLNTLQGVVFDHLAHKNGRLFGVAAAKDRAEKLERAKAPKKR